MQSRTPIRRVRCMDWIRMALLVGLMANLGCAGSGGGAGGSSPAFQLPRYAIGVEFPADGRDFSRLEAHRMELSPFFDPSLDAYGFSSGLLPFTIEFMSGAPFRWDEPLEERVMRSFVDELSRHVDIFSRVEPVPTSEPSRFVVRANILQFHYELGGDRVFSPQVTLEALVLDGRTGEVVHKVRARVTEEYGIYEATGNLNQFVYRMEDWLLTEFRERTQRALENGVEKLTDRLLDYFYRLAEEEVEKEEAALERRGSG